MKSAAFDDPRRRLEEAASRSRISLAGLSRMLGRNPSYLSQFVARGSPRVLEERDRLKLAEFLGIDEAELRSGEGYERMSRRSATVEVPRFALDASAGPGALSSEEISFDTHRLSRRWLAEMGLEGAQLSAIRVEGDSMEPLLRSGDEIFVDRSKRSGEGVFVVRLGDALHVKQVQRRPGGRIALISANEAYAPIEPEPDEVEIVGRVVWKGGRL